MAFNRDNPADLLALKNEVTLDPIGMGYASVVGQTNLLLDLINNSVNNVSPSDGPDTVTAQKLLSAIFEEPVSSQDQFKIQLLFELADGADSDLSGFKTNIADLSAGLATAVSTIIKPLSRAEVLFSNIDANGITETVILTRADWSAARDS